MTRRRDWSVLRTRDPVSGDPAELLRVARACERTAQALADGAAALRAIGCRSSTWVSPAGAAFRARTGDAVAALELVRPRFERTADVLAGYARAVEQAQDEADALLTRAWRAHDERQDADRACRAADDPGQQRLWAHRAEDAQRRLDAADRALADVEASWWRAGTAAAAELEEVTDADGLDDGWDVLAGVAVLADVAGQVSAVLGVMALTCLVLPVGPAVVAGLAGASVLAGLISVAALHELWVHDRVTGAAFATEAVWALAGLLTGGLAHGLRGAPQVAGAGRAAGAERAAGAGAGGRLRGVGATAADGASHGIGPGRAAWQARSPDPAPAGPAGAACPAPADADRREGRRGVGSTA